MKTTFLALLVCAAAYAQTAPSALNKADLEAYLRNMELWTPQVTVTIDDPKPAPYFKGFNEVVVHLRLNGQGPDYLAVMATSNPDAAIEALVGQPGTQGSTLRLAAIGKINPIALDVFTHMRNPDPPLPQFDLNGVKQGEINFTPYVNCTSPNSSCHR